MFGLIKGLFGATPVEADPRPLLEAAVREFGGEALAQRALALCDDEAALRAYLLAMGAGSEWLESARSPAPAERAFDTFFHLLSEEGRIGNIDWASGPDDIAEEMDRLFASVAAPKLTSVERAEIEAKAVDAERGEVMPRAIDLLEAFAVARGFALRWLDMGWDAHVPLIARAASIAQWEGARFGKRFPVLP